MERAEAVWIDLKNSIVANPMKKPSGSWRAGFWSVVYGVSTLVLHHGKWVDLPS